MQDTTVEETVLVTETETVTATETETETTVPTTEAKAEEKIGNTNSQIQELVEAVKKYSDNLSSIKDKQKQLLKQKAKIGIFNNMKLIGAVILSAVLMLVILLVPALREIFSIPVLPTQNIIELVLLAFAPLVIVEMFKLFKINTSKEE